MNFKQFYLGCLSHASYYLGSDGEAAIIDPQRDVQQYIDEAAANGETIKYVSKLTRTLILSADMSNSRQRRARRSSMASGRIHNSPRTRSPTVTC